MEFFSTPDLIEIGGYPFPIQGYKPTREEAVEYYRGVAAQEKLDIGLYERVLAVRGQAGEFTVHTDKRRISGAKRHHLDRLLRPAQPSERTRRGSAEGDPLLP